MKKILVIIAFVAAFVTTASAQVDFGLRGGANFSSISVSHFDTSNRTGFYVGPTVKFTVPVVGLSFDISALYDQRSVKLDEVYGLDGQRYDETVKQQQITIPINVRYGWGLSSVANVFIFAGPQFGFNVGDKDESLFNEVGEWTLNSSNFSLNAGLGATVLKHLEIKANYNFVLGHTGDISVGSVKENFRNNAWQLTAAIYF